MKGLDKLIYNELLSRRPVVLPEIGVLSVERDAQADLSQGPRSKVVLNRNIPVGTPSVIDYLSGLGIDPAAAQQNYKEWLDDARRGDEIRIQGVGLLENGIFTPSASFNEVLNPAFSDGSHVPAERKCGSCWAAWLIPAVMVVAGILIYHCIVHGCPVSCGERKTKVSTEAVYQPQPEVIVSEAAQEVDTSEIEETAEEPVAVSMPMHYVVAGYFSQEANAESYHKVYKGAYPDVRVETVALQNGKFIVSLFSSESKGEAERMCARYQYSHYNPDLWVYSE